LGSGYRWLDFIYDVDSLVMRVRIGKSAMSYEFGFFITNWGYPIARQYEIGINFFNYSLGIELYKEDNNETD